MIKLEAGASELRPLQPEDAESIARYANNRNIWKNVRDYFPYPYQLSDAISFITSEGNKNPPNNLGIIYNQECIGVIGYYRLQDVYHLTADFGYWLAEPFWGQGIMSAVVPVMIEYIFSGSDIVRLQSSVFSYNRPSMKVLEKNGFALDCIAWKAVFKDGMLIDEYRYSLLKPGT